MVICNGLSYYGSITAIGSSALQNICLACDSKTNKDGAAGMEESLLQGGLVGRAEDDGRPSCEVIIIWLP